jgi:arylsulfatase A-like enzyme
VQRFRAAEVVRQASSVDLGGPSAAAALVAGWATPEVDPVSGETFAWATAETATAELVLVETGFDSLELRCRPFDWNGAPEQTVTVAVNGRELGRVVLSGGFDDYSLPLPRGALLAGRNRVELRFGRTGRPADHQPDSDDARTLAAAVSRLGLAPESSADPGDPRVETGGTEPAGLVLPPGVGLTYRFPAPRDGSVELEAASPTGGSTALVWLARPGEPGSKVTEVRASRRGRTARIAIDRAPGEPVELGVAAAPGGAELTLRTARVLGRSVAGDAPASLLLVVVDTLRADALGAYGSSNRTPVVDDLAARGVRFARARSTIPITGPSHASLFTGLLPMEHGVHNNAQHLGADLPTLAEVLRASGRRTAGVISLGVLQREFGFDRGFDVYGDAFSRDWLKDAVEVTDEALEAARRLSGLPYFLFVHYSDPHEPYAPPDGVYPTIELSLDGRPVGELDAGGRGFRFRLELPAGASVLGFELTGAHEPGRVYRVDNLLPDDPSIRVEALDGWRVIPRRMERMTFESKLPATFRLVNPGIEPETVSLLLSVKKLLSIPEIRAAYAGETELVDRQLGRLLAGLSELGMIDGTLVVVTSDHGEGLGDHGHVGHISQLYDSLLHVPLILTWPGRLPEGVTVDEPVSLVDLFPTVVELLGLPGPTAVAGRSLAPLIGGAPGPGRPIIAATYRPESSVDARAIVLDGLKLIRSWRDDQSRHELYDVEADPGEIEDLAASRSEELERLVTELDRLLAELAERAPVDAALDEEGRAHLEALGYIH